MGFNPFNNIKFARESKHGKFGLLFYVKFSVYILLIMVNHINAASLKTSFESHIVITILKIYEQRLTSILIDITN